MTDRRSDVAKNLSEIMYMLSMFPQQDSTPELKELRVQGYLEAVGTFPNWAVERARVKVCRGLYPELNRAFAPAPPQFAELVRDLLVQSPSTKAPGISFDGETPVTWVHSTDPRWNEFCEQMLRGRPGSSRVRPHASKYAPNATGAFFPTTYLGGQPPASPKYDEEPPPDIAVMTDFDHLRADLHPGGRTAHEIYEDVMGGTFRKLA